MTLHRSLSECLRALYGNDAIDRLEAAPEPGRDEDAVAFGDVMTELAGLPAEPDDAERARFAETLSDGLRDAITHAPALARVFDRALNDLTVEVDEAEQARFEEQCARELAGDYD